MTPWPEPKDDGVVKVDYLGHACFLLTTAKAKILIDPFLTGNPKAANTAEKVSADLILVSHGHGDHYGDAVAIAKRTGAMIVAPMPWVSRRARSSSGLPLRPLPKTKS